MPAEMRVAILECAGNSRVFLVPQVQGAQWELGAIGNTEWTGVPLCALLERAGLEEGACEIVLEGPDRGVPKEGAIPPGPISYARSLPRAKALQREVLIAYQHGDVGNLIGSHRRSWVNRHCCPGQKMAMAMFSLTSMTRTTPPT